MGKTGNNSGQEFYWILACIVNVAEEEERDVFRLKSFSSQVLQKERDLVLVPSGQEVQDDRYTWRTTILVSGEWRLPHSLLVSLLFQGQESRGRKEKEREKEWRGTGRRTGKRRLVKCKEKGHRERQFLSRNHLLLSLQMVCRWTVSI